MLEEHAVVVDKVGDKGRPKSDRAFGSRGAEIAVISTRPLRSSMGPFPVTCLVLYRIALLGYDVSIPITRAECFAAALISR
jgi:hypothetical protein